MQEAWLPALTGFQLVDEDEASTSYATPRLSYTEKGIWMANQSNLPRSFSMTRIPRFNLKV